MQAKAVIVEEDVPAPKEKAKAKVELPAITQEKTEQVIEVTPKGSWVDHATLVSKIFTSDNIFAAVIFAITLSFIVAFIKAQKSHNLQWTDLITKIGSNSVSLTKLLQLIGGIVATWIMIKMTIQEKLDWEIFGLYLAYVASIEGYSKYISAKYSDKMNLGSGRLPGDYNEMPNEEETDLYRKPNKTKLPPVD